MSRLLLLFVCLIWIAGVVEPSVRSYVDADATVGYFLGAFVVVVAGVGLWCRWLARRVSGHNFGRSIHQLNWALLLSRVFVVTWFAAGVFAMGWPAFVLDRLSLGSVPAQLPAMVVGIAPAVLAWVALWWAQFPADSALRQQGMVDSLVEGLPIHRPPGLASFMASNLRLQVLFTLVPLLLIVAVHDVAALLILPQIDPLARPGVPPAVVGPHLSVARDPATDQADGLIWLLSAASVFAMAPEVLRRILQTSPMADGPLRRRLEALCRRSGVRVRDILVWHTHYHVGNAAVMGLFPRFRYVLLSDLLLERMDDEQIEAVFAHEAGHVVHRHMSWFVVFFLILILLSAGPGSLLGDWVTRAWTLVPAKVVAAAGLPVAVLTFFLTFGFLSRRFERQADVYAARLLEATRPADAAAGAASLAPLFNGGSDLAKSDPKVAHAETHVGTYGANLFSSALHRVARINNIPVTPRTRPNAGLIGHVSYLFGSLVDLAHDWLHGSIASRMAYLRGLSEDPALTGRFDRLMTRVYGTLLFALIASVAYVGAMFAR